MEFVMIAPASLRVAWPRVREGLDAMPPEDWIAEDVYHAIKSGEAALYCGYENESYAGFFVLTRKLAEFSGTPILHVWLGYNAGDRDVFTEAQSFIQSQARQLGAQRITFGSPRLGWGKRYALLSATYEVPMETP